MSVPVSIILIMVVFVLYAILINIFSVLFRITGMSSSRSMFQAVSIFTGVGFTTKESEIITSNKTRRKIAATGMITGNIFNVLIVSLLLNLILSFSNQQVLDSLLFISVAFGVFLFVIVLIQLPPIKKGLQRCIEKTALYLMKRNRHDNIITIMDDYGKDCICEVVLNRVPEILKDKTLSESKLKDHYKMNIMVYDRKGKAMDVTRNTIFEKGDVLVVFGSYQNIVDCFKIKKKELAAIVEEEAIKKNVVSLIDNYGKEAMAEIEINILPEILKDKNLFESGIKRKYDINVAMIKRNDEHIAINKDTIIQENDVIIVFGNYNKIKDCFINDIK